MWVLTHSNDLVDAEKLKVITIVNEDNHYSIYGCWDGDDAILLGSYPTVQEAEQAIVEIFNHIKYSHFEMPKYDNKEEQ
jgi:hypothetical protein